MTSPLATSLVLFTLCTLLGGGLGRLRGADAQLHAAAFARGHALAAAAIAAARRERALWRNTEALLERAVHQAAAGESRGALDLAYRARREAELARNQAKLEFVRYRLDLYRETVDEPTIRRLERVLRRHDGWAAAAAARQAGLAQRPGDDAARTP